jgi:putative flippase GtrA
MSNFSNICILIPSFNPDDNLSKLIKEIAKHKWNKIIVVDDGSSKSTKPIFHDLCNNFEITFLSHEANKGKGRALKTGIEYIKNSTNNCDGFITVDADGQHLVKDIQKIAKSAIDNKKDVIFGVRGFGKNTPFSSAFGNKVTRFLLHAMNNIAIDDTQTGLRYLPNSLLDDLLILPGKRYEYELECLITINNLGYKIIQIQIETVYIENNKGSHFRGLMDSSRVLLIFIRYSVISLSSFGIDILFFAIILSYSDSIFYAVIFARIVSGSFNFILNKLIAFKSYSKNKLSKELILYFLLWGTLVLLSANIVGLAEDQAVHSILLFKVFVDSCLFFLSFYIQKNIIFNDNYRLNSNFKNIPQMPIKKKDKLVNNSDNK